MVVGRAYTLSESQTSAVSRQYPGGGRQGGNPTATSIPSIIDGMGMRVRFAPGEFPEIKGDA